jgi:hypothetical protein
MTAEISRYIKHLRRQLKEPAFKENALIGFELRSILNRIEELVDSYEFSPAGYLNLDKNGRIRNANLTASQ